MQKWALFLGVTLASAFAGIDAKAQAYAAEQAVPVRVQVWGREPGLGYQLELVRPRDVVVARCPGNCFINVVPGSYRLRVFDKDGSPLGARVVRVDRSCDWVVGRPDAAGRDAGLTMGIAGSILIPVGFIATLPYLFIGLCEGDCNANRDEKAEFALLGLAAIITGAVLTPIGWAGYARSRSPRIEIRPGLTPVAERRPSLATRNDSTKVTGLELAALTATLRF